MPHLCRLHPRSVRLAVTVLSRHSKLFRRTTVNAGFTLVEAMMSVTLIAILSLMASAGYAKYTAAAKNTAAIADIGKILLTINRYRMNNDGAAPKSLADIRMDTMRDPWGNEYRYLDFAGVKGNGGKRKDRNLVPINSDFDLYSVGPDGNTAGPLTAKASQDDIIMANNGKFIGPASKY